MISSSGIYGESPDISRWFIVCACLFPNMITNDDFISVMARPLSPNDHTFGIGITGQNFDPTDLGEPGKLEHFIKTETGRTDLVFGEFSWLSYFK